MVKNRAVNKMENDRAGATKKRRATKSKPATKTKRAAKTKRATKPKSATKKTKTQRALTKKKAVKKKNTWLEDRIEKRLATKQSEVEAGWPPQGWETQNSFPADPTPVAILEWLDHLTSGDRVRVPVKKNADTEYFESEENLVPLDFLQNQRGGRKKGKGNALARDVYRLVHHLNDAHGWDNAPQEEMGVVYSYHDVRTLIRKVSKWIRYHDKPPQQSLQGQRGSIGYLRLIVDKHIRTIRRAGNKKYEGKVVDLSADGVLWEAFIILFAHEGRAPTKDQWTDSSKYSGERSGLRTVMGRLREKLLPLDVTVQKREFALIEADPSVTRK